MKKCHRFSIVIIALLLLVPVLPGQAGQTNQDKTQKNQSEYYEVDVTVQLLPVFAVDKKGDPVYDLKKEEIEFQVDGKPAEILSFTASRMDVEEFTRPPVQGAETKKVPAPMRPTERINFIILDTLIGNAKTMEINKYIAAAIITKATAGDSYVIFQTNQGQGFKYVIGPEKDKTKLFQALRNIRVPYIRRSLRGKCRPKKKGLLHEFRHPWGEG